jgi:hypothetical protein
MTTRPRGGLGISSGDPRSALRHAEIPPRSQKVR